MDRETIARAICAADHHQWPDDKVGTPRDYNDRFQREHFLKLADAVLALVRPALDDDWQPIETAPKDGTPIEVRMPADWGWWVATARLREDSDHWTDGASILHYNGTVLVSGFRGPLTHWRPLPAPPAGEGG